MRGGGMIVTTTPSIEGSPITDYLGIVTGEAILGEDIFPSEIASVRDIGAYEQGLGKARETALREMQDRARELGAMAIVGVDLDYAIINNNLMVSASGTAVKLG